MGKQKNGKTANKDRIQQGFKAGNIDYRELATDVTFWQRPRPENPSEAEFKSARPVC